MCIPSFYSTRHLVAALTIIALVPMAAFAGDGPVGKWNISVNAQGQIAEAVLIIVEEDGKYSGTQVYQGERELSEISYEDGELSFKIEIPEAGMSAVFTATIDGDSLEGKYVIAEMGIEMITTGTRAGEVVALSELLANQVVAKYVEATGGVAAQETVNSAILKANASFVDLGIEMEVVIYYKNGDYKQVIEIPDMGLMIIEGVIDDVAFTVDPMEGNVILEGEAAELMKNKASLNPLLNWKERYASAEITGEEDGVTIVVFKTHGGTETTCHFDNVSGLLTKQSGNDPNALSTQSSDYKKVGDISVAHTLVLETLQGKIDVAMTSVELNVDIDDSTFKLPKEIVALQPRERTEGITAEQVMAMMDTNGDGKITMDEAPEQLKTAFSMVDQNADEGIDLTEAQFVADFMNGQYGPQN